MGRRVDTDGGNVKTKQNKIHFMSCYDNMEWIQLAQYKEWGP